MGDWLGPAALRSLPDAATIRDGLSQLNRYLGRAWSRAGIAPQQHEDCTQAVYETLLEQLGRTGFDHLASDVGQHGVRVVLNRDTSEGPDFFAPSTWSRSGVSASGRTSRSTITTTN